MNLLSIREDSDFAFSEGWGVWDPLALYKMDDNHTQFNMIFHCIKPTKLQKNTPSTFLFIPHTQQCYIQLRKDGTEASIQSIPFKKDIFKSHKKYWFHPKWGLILSDPLLFVLGIFDGWRVWMDYLLEDLHPGKY